MINWRPCGACGELVHIEDGCTHWRLGTKRTLAARREAGRQQ